MDLCKHLRRFYRLLNKFKTFAQVTHSGSLLFSQLDKLRDREVVIYDTSVNLVPLAHCVFHQIFNWRKSKRNYDRSLQFAMCAARSNTVIFLATMFGQTERNLLSMDLEYEL